MPVLKLTSTKGLPSLQLRLGARWHMFLSHSARPHVPSRPSGPPRTVS